ncbi:GLPGLI family protein [Gramella sp. BOM4]|nr:GLPGLI family protein [Christiangramia bathymodioli]
MKLNLFILFLLNLVFIPLHSQEHELEYKITYQLTYKPDSTQTENRTETMWLFSGTEASLFLSAGQALKDSLKQNANLAMIGSQQWKEKTKATKTDFDFRIYKDREKGMLHHAEKIFQDKLFYTQPLSQISWNMEQESKELFGYLAQKATTSFAGREYIAWFTPEIPITDGPYKFSGLPGLILQLEDAAQDYIFSFTGLEKLEDPIRIQVPPATYQVSEKEDFLALKARFEEDPIKYVNNYVGSGGKTIRIEMPESKKKRLKKQREAEMNRNPIELK